MAHSPDLVGPDWLNSYEKQEFEAEMMGALRSSIVRTAAHTALMAYNCFGYTPFEQERFGEGCELRMVPKIQTQTGKNLEWGTEDHKESHPILKLVRDMGLDELPQVRGISSDALDPGNTALIGFRPRMPKDLKHRHNMAAKFGYTSIVDQWTKAFSEVPTALYDITSLLDSIYTPHSLEYDLMSMKLQIYYHEHASRQLDETIFRMTLVGGLIRLKHFGLVQIHDPKEVFEDGPSPELENLLDAMDFFEQAAVAKAQAQK